MRFSFAFLRNDECNGDYRHPCLHSLREPDGSISNGRNYRTDTSAKGSFVWLRHHEALVGVDDVPFTVAKVPVIRPSRCYFVYVAEFSTIRAGGSVKVPLSIGNHS